LSIITILLFLVYTIGLGHGLFLLSKLKIDDFLERITIKLGLGLCTFIVLGVFFNLIRIPLDWRLFLLLSLIGPGYSIIKNPKMPKIELPKKLKKSHIYGLILILLFVFVIFMHTKGAFSYPWLEDGDPWTHLIGTKYVTNEKTVYEPGGNVDFFFYIDPYPPGYDMTMGILDQTANDVMWTLKFFNALMLALAVVFSHYFFKKLTKSSNKAIFATFVLAMLPSFMSHFIWAHTLAITLVPIIFYCAVSILENKKWVYMTGIALGASVLVQPTQPIKFIVLFLIFAGISFIADKKSWKPFLKVLIIGGIIGLLWWGPLMIQHNNVVDSFGKRSFYYPEGRMGRPDSIPHFGLMGTATRLYTFDDFVFVGPNNMINNPVGWGFFASILVALGLIAFLFNYKKLNPKKKRWELFALLWFIFAFAGLYGGTVLPIALFSFRFWALISFPAALLAAQGWFFVAALLKKYQGVKVLLFIVIVIGIIITSGVPKYQVNTATWGTNMPSVGYVALENIEPTKMLYACNHEFFYPNAAIQAFGHENCFWCKDVREFEFGFFNMTPTEVRNYMDQQNYNYLIADKLCFENHEQKEVEEKLNALLNEGFTIQHTEQDGFWLFRK
jgi:hypothetical protein